uniref:Uncharacterized protein n=1 Tax=Monodon monoceros TaxID=40151 RepID=A0A8C6F6Q7_MONMO
VHGHEESWGGNQDELQRPQTHMGNGEKVVVADAVAARLEGVTDEGRLLVTPHALGSHHQHHDSEDKDDREPHSANGSRMPVHTTEQGVQTRPIHPASFTPAKHEPQSKLSGSWGRKPGTITLPDAPLPLPRASDKEGRRRVIAFLTTPSPVLASPSLSLPPPSPPSFT